MMFWLLCVIVLFCVVISSQVIFAKGSRTLAWVLHTRTLYVYVMTQYGIIITVKKIIPLCNGQSDGQTHIIDRSTMALAVLCWRIVKYIWDRFMDHWITFVFGCYGIIFSHKCSISKSSVDFLFHKLVSGHVLKHGLHKTVHIVFVYHIATK